MYIRTIRLRDWKAYESAVFEFPSPSARKNVVLIGGQNGFGKTTLFEALVLGLFGQDGLPLVLRAGVSADSHRLAQNFKTFMERALFSGALQAGRTSCSIELEFVDDNQEPIVIMRKWSFTTSGSLRQGETMEELRIFHGRARTLIAPGRNDPDPNAWYRDWVSRKFLPTSLAGFFLFDGESASIYAEHDMGIQVRKGIEGLLGLDWLHRLAADLRAYAANRRNMLPKGVSTEEIARLDAAIAEMEAEIRAAEERREKLESELAASERERDGLTRELAGYGGGTRAEYEELIREQADYRRQYETSEGRLREIAEMDLPFALAGAGLRGSTYLRLEQERQRDQWEAATSQRGERTSQVVELLEDRLAVVEPPLTSTQGDSVKSAVREALEHLWFPPPDGVADSFRHPHARGPILQRVLDRLASAEKVSSAAVNELLEAMLKISAKLREVDAAIRRSDGAAPQLDQKRERLSELNLNIGHLHQERGELNNRLTSRMEDLKQKRSEVGRLSAQLGQTERPARLASRADEVAGMIDQLVEDAWPQQTQQVAEEMTRAIRKMAHRGDYLRSVEINDEGEVALLSPKGDDLRQLDLSAGEKQIFTQALFSAVATVSERDFPLVVDTPLGRLDDTHRVNVLTHLALRSGQVILISTDTEVVGPYLDAIRSRVAKTYIIRNEVRDGIARSWPEEGYFAAREIQ